MKAICLALACLALVVLAENSALPALPDPKLPLPRSYTVECHMVLVPGKSVAAVVPELDDETRVVAGWAKLQAMIARGEVTLADYLLGKGFERSDISAGSLVDAKYPTEYEDAKLPWPLPVTAQSLERLKFWPHVGIVPTAFDAVNVGPTLSTEIKRTTDPGLLQCELTFRHVHPPRERQFDAGRLPNGERLAYWMSDFTELRTQTQVFVESGRPKLVGVHRLPRAEGLFELVMLTVTEDPCPVPASRAANAPRWTVQAGVQMVAVPMAQACALMPELRGAASFPSAEARLQEMLAAGEAELLGWPVVEGFCPPAPNPDDPLPVIAVAESFDQVRYPSEFEPPRVPGWGDPAARVVFSGGWYLQALHAPTAFDRRATGPALELRGKIDPGHGLELKVKTQLVWLAAMEPAIGARADRLDAPSITQPRFRVLEAQAPLHVRRETRQLLGVFPERRAQPRMIFFLLHVRVQPAPTPL
ncbi:MAG TPA: hypothetical protein VGO11_00205 [Chthoniobacteraceae bacterium]|jgi:hypothetical protein|nr:hypothetical protein [Chthoniobacteraceae bacterium]